MVKYFFCIHFEWKHRYQYALWTLNNLTAFLYIVETFQRRRRSSGITYNRHAQIHGNNISTEEVYKINQYLKCENCFF